MHKETYKFHKLIKYIFIIGLITTGTIYLFVNKNINNISKNINNIEKENIESTETTEENIFDLVNKVQTETGETFIIDGIKDGQTVSGIVPIFINPEKPEEVKKIDFYVGKTLIESDSGTPFNSIWDTTKTKDGVNIISIKITKIDKTIIELKPLTITVINPERDYEQGAPTTPGGLPKPELY